MAFPTSESVSAVVAPIAASHGLDLESVKVTRAGAKSVVLVAVDADIRPDLDLLEVLSGDISAALDAAEEKGTLNFGAQGYNLEVSTPGVDTPLTEPRHWRRNRGRKVVLTEGDKRETARIGALNDAQTAVILIAREGKKLAVRSHELTPATSAVVEIEFAPAPADELDLVQKNYDDAHDWGEGK